MRVLAVIAAGIGVVTVITVVAISFTDGRGPATIPADSPQAADSAPMHPQA